MTTRTAAQQQPLLPQIPTACDPNTSTPTEPKCRNGSKACCNTKGRGDWPHAGRACHFKYGINFRAMRRERDAYHAREDEAKKNKYGLGVTNDAQGEGQAQSQNGPARGQGPHNGGIFQMNGQIINEGRYKRTADLSEDGKRILREIAIMRGNWLGKYVRQECYDCDGECRDHFTRMRAAQNMSDLEGLQQAEGLPPTGGKTRKSTRRNKKNILKSKRMRKTKRKTKRLRKTRKNKKSKKSRKSRSRR